MEGDALLCDNRGRFKKSAFFGTDGEEVDLSQQVNAMWKDSLND